MFMPFKLKFLSFFFLTMTAVAAPIQYNISFSSVTGSVLPSSGSFTYDASIPQFSNFHVEVEGADINLTATANSPVIAAPCVVGDASTPRQGFAIVSGATACPAQQLWFLYSSGFELFSSVTPFTGDFGSLDLSEVIGSPSHVPVSGLTGGFFTITSAATAPEPSTIPLVLIAFLLGLAAVYRRRRSVVAGQ